MRPQLNDFLLGMAVMAAAVAGLFFLRFWRRTRDRLFIIFAVAFWLMGLNWLLLAAVGRDETKLASLYAIRLLAFCLILFAVVDKNRRPRA
ncbi:MAG TPA: DUF5985 family protein [Tepidisphaeraceae bacterium]|nr:DUF5985 family protein [Tepidisphaeraceae bacterium]